jgi:hypothetical protein
MENSKIILNRSIFEIYFYKVIMNYFMSVIIFFGKGKTSIIFLLNIFIRFNLQVFTKLVIQKINRVYFVFLDNKILISPTT